MATPPFLPQRHEERRDQKTGNQSSVPSVASVVNESEIKRTALRSVRHPFQDTPLPTPGWRGIPAWNARHPSPDRAPTDPGFLTSYPGVPDTPARIDHHPTPEMPNPTSESRIPTPETPNPTSES